MLLVIYIYIYIYILLENLCNYVTDYVNDYVTDCNYVRPFLKIPLLDFDQTFRDGGDPP